MVLGIAGSRTLNIPLPNEIMPTHIDGIISGGAIGIDRCARHYANKNHILITELLPEYDLYGRRAPLLRNDLIIRLSDMMYIFWDKKSRGTYYVIKKCQQMNKPYKVFIVENGKYIQMNNIPIK